MTVREEVRERIERDALLAKLRKKIGSGKGTYADTAAYSIRAGKLLGEVFSRRLPEIPLEEREPLCVELLHDRYIDINAAVDTAQRFMDEALGIHIAPQHAPFDSERGHQIGSSLRDLSKPVETLQRRAQSAPETATKSMHDDRMKAESKFRHRAGLDCRITRVAVNGCCPWCSKVAGRYRYGEEPDDIYRRHDNCDCTVTFENGRKRQDVWSKREWEAPQEDAGVGERVVLTEEQARNAGAGAIYRMAGNGRIINAKPVQHSMKKLQELAEYAKSKGIFYQNAMQFDGDLSLMRKQIDAIALVRDQFKISQRIIIRTNPFLFKDLGETDRNGKKISFNPAAFRSEEETINYLNADNRLSSTEVIGIGIHEMGHIIAKRYGEIGLDIAMKTCYNIYGESYTPFQTLDYLSEHISLYSTELPYEKEDKPFNVEYFHEIIPEVLAKHYTNPDEYTTEFMRLLKEAYDL